MDAVTGHGHTRSALAGHTREGIGDDHTRIEAAEDHTRVVIRKGHTKAVKGGSRTLDEMTGVGRPRPVRNRGDKYLCNE
jgi:hypothetical protein